MTYTVQGDEGCHGLESLQPRGRARGAEND